MQIPGNGHASPVIHAVVATQAGADVLFAAFPGFFDNFGVSHGRAAHQNIVGLPFGQNFFGNGGIINAADGAYGNLYTGFFHDFAGVGIVRRAFKPGWALFGPGHGIDAMAAGDMHHINIRLEDFDLFRTFLRRNAALHFVIAVHAQFNQQAVAHHVADGLDDHEREGAALFDGTAEFVSAVVGERGKEIVEKPAVSEMQAEPVKVGYLRPVGIFAEQGGYFFQFSFRGRRCPEMGLVIG